MLKDGAVLEVKDLKTWFYTRRGTVKAVNGIDFSLGKGECLCLVGESGCGKSVTALSILRLIESPPGRIISGEILYQGTDLVTCSQEQLRQIRGKGIAMIFQNAQSALNPVFTIGDQIIEQINAHAKLDRDKAIEKARMLLEEMRIPDSKRALTQYPHQMSGGMRQRAMIAMSLSCDPDILIADEPTTAVDVTIRAQIMDILHNLKIAREMSIIFITHDLSLVREIGDRAAVVYAGSIVEIAPVENILQNPLHPYTRGLISCLPDVSSDLKRLPFIPGNAPNPIAYPDGCTFHPRCPRVMDICRHQVPELKPVSEIQAVACHLYNS